MLNPIRFLALLALMAVIATPAASQMQLWKGKHECRGQNPQERAFLDAAARGDLELFLNYLRQGADPNTKDDCGVSVLTYAAESHHLEILKQLVAHEAAVNAVDDFRREPPLIWVIDSYSKEAGDQDRDNVLEVVKVLVHAGADPNAKAANHQPVLTMAVIEEMENVVEFLIARGARINALDGEDRTAYSYAAKMGNLSLKRLLISAGADSTIGVSQYQREYGTNAFIQAASDGRTDVVEAMLAGGTNVNTVNEAVVS